MDNVFLEDDEYLLYEQDTQNSIYGTSADPVLPDCEVPDLEPVMTYYEIDALNLPFKIRNTCIRKGIVTIPQLQAAYENGTLKSFRGLGPAALKTIQLKLSDPDAPLPKPNEAAIMHIHQLQTLCNRARKENDEDSLIALNWAISKLQKLSVQHQE